MREKFCKDLHHVYQMLQDEQEELQKFYDLLHSCRSLFDPKMEERYYIIEEFLEYLSLEVNEETMLAAITRLVNLREDALLQVIRDLSEDEQIKVREKAYVWVSNYYLSLFQKRIEKIEKAQLLTPFYRAILRHAHSIGEVFSSWHTSWMAQIIYGINRELFEFFNGDEEKIFYMLNEKQLFDRGHSGEPADRSYSVLKIDEEGNFHRLSYAQAFKEEVDLALQKIDEVIQELGDLEDEVFHLENEWRYYFKKIKEALKEEDPDRLIAKWADVDRAWMQITSPVQIGHPLEYYEDRYRKAVALEWDVRIENPKYPKKDHSKKMELMFRKLYDELGVKAPSVYESTLQNLQKTQLYVGRPFSFYGSEFNGLFSAQVVPNDEVVSKEHGKKIFAYPDMILSSLKAKPPMKITTKIFGKELVKKIRRVLDEPQIWYKIYDISTIGHEYGHILWMDESSEMLMNRSGMFKNAEEFKATTGGLIAHFLFEDDTLWEYLLHDIAARAVSLIGWMEVDEVQPYYVEGLLHLQGLFACGVFSLNKILL
ncbi:invasion protein CiaB [Nitratiruptor sp. YY09-18]|uniref:invasion protein CiaB n=1 Tax=Nitratiruptor sp. YY09-18 TaxID=2724901 RepID=UPI001915DE1A|nr:invasion protein CiaB [Nitratiruptor sp. YY09-18]BCD68759.1 hypothetical protein NitYY0918_C1676 [Nitratiruptor sp. YY09-18]